MFMSLLLVAPLIAILGYLTYKAWPALILGVHYRKSSERHDRRRNLGSTCRNVLLSVCFVDRFGTDRRSWPGFILNEYAKDNWWTRFINLAVVNLAGVPSIVHALFGVGAFVLVRSGLVSPCLLHPAHWQ